LQQQELIVEKPGDTGLFLFVIAPLGANAAEIFFRTPYFYRNYATRRV